MGVAGVLAIGGAAYGILALENQSSFDATPTIAARTDALSNARISDALLGSALGVALVGTIYYVVTLPRKSRAVER
jgi:hypothetical protein